MHIMNTQISSALGARERILLAAQKLFYCDGIRATGINRVIAESSVTKVTFYRHFSSKDVLILETLEYRHNQWIAWFIDAIQRYGGSIEAITPALSEWFLDDGFRGCTFINSVGEMADALPEIVNITRRHKQEVQDIIATLLPPSEKQVADAQALTVAIDGAIIRAQFEQSPDAAISSLKRISNSLLAPLSNKQHAACD